MSVNGDLMVVRNGRSTSQVSVYNYPEHLNPFYEDDNHKRLRFWKLNKGAKDGQGRRNSFSLGGLKDMWAFKSFRMKKKSSSLGINKTSESPPPLRRDIYAQENGYSTYDPRMRYTTGATNGLGGANAFQRNVPYRSSLQDMRSSQPETPINGIGFNRNDRYRSTIQTAATTSGTSSSSPTQSLTLPQPRRSSQTSVASTNPFDDDDDEDVVMGSVSATSTPSKNPGRKKRRAPPPPVPAHQIIKEESSSAGSTPSHKPSTTAQENERLEIQNLTAEIESFVNSSNSDDVCVSGNTTSQSTNVSNSPKQNGTIPKVRTSPTQKPNGAVTKDVDIIITNDSEPLFIREDEDIERDSQVKIVEKPIQTPVREIGHVEAIHVHVENTRSTPEKIEPSRVSTFRSEVRTESPEKAPKRASPEKQVSSTRVVEIVEVHKSTDKSGKPVESLKNKESPEKPKIAAKPNIPKSPPPVSPRMTRVTREESYPIETPDTPAMRRREIKIEADLPSTPDSPRREIETFATPVRSPVYASPSPASESPQQETETFTPATKPHQEKSTTASPTTKPKEVSITIVTTTTQTRTSEETASPEVPVPALRENRTISTEQTSPLPAARKVNATESEIGQVQSTKKDVEPPQIKVEEKISNLDAKLPQLQLKISEELPKQENVVSEDSKLSEEPSAEPSVASTSSAAGAQSAPIDKPPRTKHFVEEIPDDIYRPRPSQWKQSTLAPLEPVPPEKRRSVKQIIESINRSQRLLNGKKVDEPEIEATDSQRNMSESNTNAMEQNLKSLAESQREMKRMLEELDGLENTHHEQKLSNRSDENFQGILDTIVSTLARETAKKNNGEVFKKCTITKEVTTTTSRESSPTSSNLDWNPVPKPKRTKNLSPELQVKRNNTDNE